MIQRSRGPTVRIRVRTEVSPAVNKLALPSVDASRWFCGIRTRLVHGAIACFGWALVFCCSPPGARASLDVPKSHMTLSRRDADIPMPSFGAFEDVVAFERLMDEMVDRRVWCCCRVCCCCTNPTCACVLFVVRCHIGFAIFHVDTV